MLPIPNGMNKKNFYITTTLPYVNAEPHVGFAMEIIRADVIARYKKLLGFEIFFNTGTDEHGQKLVKSAETEGIDVKSYVDKNSQKFRDLLQILNILSEVHFIRTTDESHEKSAQEFWKKCFNNGYIYKKNYQAKYCVGCELEKTDSELNDKMECPIHPGRTIELIDEENYFFKFSEFGIRLLDFYKKNPNFVTPNFRFNEIKTFVENGLTDFSISRQKSKMSWGVPVPGDSEHVMYVWFDALVNYISTLGWPENIENFEKFWVNGNPTQYCGKDNLRQQSAMWQAMLMAADIPNSKQIIINGFITGEGGVKMSKSLGNGIDPIQLIEEYKQYAGDLAGDILRYFVLRHINSFEDSPMTREMFYESYNAGLANGLGNLVSRVLTMAENYGVGGVESKESIEEIKELENFEISRFAENLWTRLANLDKYIQENEPFKKWKVDPEGAKKDVLYLMKEISKLIPELSLIIPKTSKKIKELLKVGKRPAEPLFKRKI